MTDQIQLEYWRTIDNYERALNDAQRLIEAELQTIKIQREEGYRFHVSHRLLDLGWTIIRTDNKLSVFSNLVWRPQ